MNLLTVFPENLQAEDLMAFKRLKIYRYVATTVPGREWREHPELIKWARENKLWPQEDIDRYDFITKECRRSLRLVTLSTSECECVLLRKRIVHRVFHNLAGFYLRSTTTFES